VPRARSGGRTSPMRAAQSVRSFPERHIRHDQIGLVTAAAET
jgi:hypothetical protein